MDLDTPQSHQVQPSLEAVEYDDFIEIVITTKTFLRDQAREFKNLTKEYISREKVKFLINFKKCEYISSEGLGCIAEFWHTCSEQDEFIMVSLFGSMQACVWYW